jgi:hypothetical protein
LRRLSKRLQDCAIAAVLIDFTLEEDGYTPVFYGLEALRDTLADLLPEAEARAMYQLLDLTSCTWRLKPQLHKQNLPPQVTKPLIFG